MVTASPQPGNQDERCPEWVVVRRCERPAGHAGWHRAGTEVRGIATPYDATAADRSDHRDESACPVVPCPHFVAAIGATIAGERSRAAAAAGETGAGEEADVVREWMKHDSRVPEGRCPATECWYTLPLNADGLVVQHSQSGTLSTCEGGGRPPRPAATEPAPSAGHVHVHVDDYDGVVDCDCSAPSAGQDSGPWRVGRSYRLHVYEGDRPVATFHHAEDAARAVTAVNRQQVAPDSGSGPLAQLTAERDEARATVQRVRELVEMAPVVRFDNGYPVCAVPVAEFVNDPLIRRALGRQP